MNYHGWRYNISTHRLIADRWHAERDDIHVYAHSEKALRAKIDSRLLARNYWGKFNETP